MVFEEGCHVYEFLQITSQPTISRCKEFLIDIVTFCTSLKHSTVEGCHQIYPPIIREQKIRGNTFVALLGRVGPLNFVKLRSKVAKLLLFTIPNHSSMNSRAAAADVEQILSKVQTKNTTMASFHKVYFIFLKKYDQSSSD